MTLDVQCYLKGSPLDGCGPSRPMVDGNLRRPASAWSWVEGQGRVLASAPSMMMLSMVGTNVSSRIPRETPLIHRIVAPATTMTWSNRFSTGSNTGLYSRKFARIRSAPLVMSWGNMVMQRLQRKPPRPRGVRLCEQPRSRLCLVLSGAPESRAIRLPESILATGLHGSEAVPSGLPRNSAERYPDVLPGCALLARGPDGPGSEGTCLVAQTVDSVKGFQNVWVRSEVRQELHLVQRPLHLLPPTHPRSRHTTSYSPNRLHGNHNRVFCQGSLTIHRHSPNEDSIVRLTAPPNRRELQG